MATRTRRKKATTEQQSVGEVSEQPTVDARASDTTTTATKETKMVDTPSIIEFSEDISTAEAPPPLPPGDYTAEIRGAEVKTSAKGNRYLAISFFINPDEYPADYTEGNADGTTLTYNRVTVGDTPQERYRVRKLCESVGAPMGRSLDVNEFIGKSATVEVATETYEGEDRATIKRVKEA